MENKHTIYSDKSMYNQIEIFDINSPCQRVCQTDKSGYCLTCYRSRQERFDWLTFSNEQRREILRLCKQRELRKRYYLFQQKQEKKAKSHSQHSENEQLGLF